jgi:hypothetical protein
MRAEDVVMNAPVIGRKPAWWLLCTDAAALAGLIGLIEVDVVGEAARLMLEMATVIVTFALMLVWLRVNRGRIELAEALGTGHASLETAPDRTPRPRPVSPPRVPWKPARADRRAA